MADISKVLLPIADSAPTLQYGMANNTNATATSSSNAAQTTSGGVTGIIIDGTGLGLRPAMSPRILNQDGSVVYGPSQYSRDYAASNGVVGYAKTLDQAKNDPRVQGNPLIIRGTSIFGSSAADITISNTDAGKASSADGSASLFSNCRVMFVLD